MRKEHIIAGARIFSGLIFFVFGLNGFLQFLPMPPAPEKAAAFMGALMATGYVFPVVKGIEVVAGAMLLSNRFVPLALTLLAPIVVNIVAVHTFLTPPSPLAFIVLALEIGLAWAYRDSFRGVLQSRAVPVSADKDIEPAPRTATA